MKEYIYEEIRPESYDEVLVHLRWSFFPDEPLNRSLRLCKPGEPHPELEEFSLQVMKHGLSFLARDASTSKVVGVLLNSGENRDEHTGNHHPKKTYEDEKLQKIFGLLEKYDNENDIFKDFNIKRLFELRILSVDVNHRGQGIAAKLYALTEDLARHKNYEMLRTDATALFSQKLFEKYGFKTINEIVYQEFPTKEDPWFPTEPPHVSLKVMIKEFK